MPGLLPDIDPDGLLEYSVVFTDRSLNHMSRSFQSVMTDISTTLKKVYKANALAIVPGGGTYAMEAVARQFAPGQHCLVIRNGWFSFRWTQILDTGNIPAGSTVLKARRIDKGKTSPFVPAPIEEVVATIDAERPAVIFAPHVETSAGLMLPDDYIRSVADAVRAVGGLLVLDCVASGTSWVDMERCGVDVLISAPQKGWSSSPCSGLVLLNDRALQRLESTTSTSFACDLRKWLEIMRAYENGTHAYHATMPTDGLKVFRDAMLETVAYGLEKVRAEQANLGARVRELLEGRGFKNVAAPGFQASGVIVSYTEDSQIVRKFLNAGIQIAAGVPLRCDEPDDFQSFRIGLFGLEKIQNIDRTVGALARVLDSIVSG